MSYMGYWGKNIWANTSIIGGIRGIDRRKEQGTGLKAASTGPIMKFRRRQGMLSICAEDRTTMGGHSRLFKNFLYRIVQG